LPVYSTYRAARLPALAKPQSGPKIRAFGSQVHDINNSIVFPKVTIIPRAVFEGTRRSMLKSRLQAVLLLCVLATCLAYYSFISQRSDRLAKRLRLEKEYLSWDWKDTPEEILCQSNSGNIDRKLIPRTVHFILIADEGKQADLEFYQYLAIKAALLRIEPDIIKVHSYSINEANDWWQLIKRRVTLVTHKPHQTLRTSDGQLHKLRLAHQTDILRLEILHSEGGIYLDTDVYALQSFSPLLRSPKDLLMGHEGGNRSGIGNAVIVARPGSFFISRWLATYEESFDNRPQMWNHHSVKVPAELAMQYPEDICKLSPSTFFWPTWSTEHIESMHMSVVEQKAVAFKSNMSLYSGAMYANQLAYHAWGNIARTNFLSQLTPEKLLGTDSRFNILLRDIHLTEV
jgi:hypothetical protein